MNSILVVNNDIDTMSLLKSLLERFKFHVHFTSDRFEVNKLVKAHGTDLVLVDILQKNAINYLQEDKDTRHIPIILMTGFSLRENSIEYDVQDIIEKPFSIDLLMSKINHQLQIKSKHDREISSPFRIGVRH